MSSLNNAIQLIREGRKEEARQILEPLIRTESGNIQAWFWYVETCSTVEKRIQVLEVCLKVNPGNSQVTQALRTLRNQRFEQTPVAPSAVQPPKPAMAQPPLSSSSYSAIYDDSPQQRPVPSSHTPIYFDDAPAPASFVPVVPPKQIQGKQKNAWEEDNASYVDTSMLSKSKRVARSYTFFNAWTTVLLSMDIESYADVLDDPEASTGRAFEWVAYAGIISGLIFPLSLLTNPQFAVLMDMPEFKEIFGNAGTNTFLILMFSLVMMLVAPLSNVIGLALGAALYNFLAITFGGNGNYSRTAYALAAYMAPVGILSSILLIIPLVGQCLGSVLGIYNFILTVRALQASHSLSVGKALAAIFAPTIILMIFGCLVVLIVGLPAMGG
jgi:hypothetical protein